LGNIALIDKADDSLDGYFEKVKEEKLRISDRSGA